MARVQGRSAALHRSRDGSDESAARTIPAHAGGKARATGMAASKIPQGRQRRAGGEAEMKLAENRKRNGDVRSDSHTTRRKWPARSTVALCRAERGLLLVECLVYFAIWLVVMGLAFAAFF